MTEKMKNGFLFCSRKKLLPSMHDLVSLSTVLLCTPILTETLRKRK
jgi:hypothetical protein